MPTWVLVPNGNAKLWYWGQAGDSTPWYSSLKLFRQAAAREWDAPLNEIAVALNKAIADGKVASR